MANEIHGEKSYLSLVAESTWGTTPGGPTYIHVPVDSYGVSMNRDRRSASPFLGIRQQKHGRSFRGMPAGQMVVPFYGFEPTGSTDSLAKTLIEWALNQASAQAIELPSMAIEWAEGPDVANVIHNGMRVNSLTIAGDADSGRVMLTFDLMGKTETAVVTAQTIPEDRELCVEADFSDCTFAIATVAVALASFNITIANNLQVKYLNGTSPAFIVSPARVITAQMVRVKNSDTYGALNRAFVESEVALEFVMKGKHNGTGAGGTNNILTVGMPRAQFINPEVARAKDLMTEPLNFQALKPDSSSLEITTTWSQA